MNFKARHPHRSERTTTTSIAPVMNSQITSVDCIPPILHWRTQLHNCHCEEFDDVAIIAIMEPHFHSRGPFWGKGRSGWLGSCPNVHYCHVVELLAMTIRRPRSQPQPVRIARRRRWASAISASRSHTTSVGTAPGLFVSPPRRWPVDRIAAQRIAIVGHLIRV